VLLDESCTFKPPEGAAPEMVSWHALVPPPVRVCGLQDSEVTVRFVFSCGSRVNVSEAPMGEAVTDAAIFDVTVLAVAVKLALLEPAAMFTEAGTIRLALEEASVMVSPPACAGLARLRTQEDVPGVIMADGAQTRLAEEFCDGLMVSLAVRLTPPPELAEIFAAPLVAFDAAVAANPPEVAPAEIVIVPGTVTLELSLESTITTPPTGAAALMFTVQELLFPPVIAAGRHTREDTVVSVPALDVSSTEKLLVTLFRLAVTATETLELTADAAMAVKPTLL